MFGFHAVPPPPTGWATPWFAACATLLLLSARDAGQTTSEFNAGRVNGTGPYRHVEWVNGARLRSSVSLQDVSNADGDALPNSPRRLGKLNLTLPLPASMRLGGELQLEGPRNTIDGGQVGGPRRR